MGFIRRTLNAGLERLCCRPPVIRHCPQTVGKALHGVLCLYQATKAVRWREQADVLARHLLGVQRPDGGFDVGYDYFFGRWHRRGESHSSETIALIPLVDYAELGGVVPVRPAMDRCVAWIERYARGVTPGCWALPYAPYTLPDVAIPNGTSFAAAAYGCYLAATGDRDEARQARYAGLVTYADQAMMTQPGVPGRYWPYCDPHWAEADARRRAKIDYYHQAMQVEAHALAQQRRPLPAQLRMVRDGADHLVHVHDAHGLLPYCQSPEYFGDLIHTWGLSAVIPGMLEAARLVPERATEYQRVAREVVEWLLKHAWNGEFFYDVLTAAGGPQNHDYMVRSDAWIFHALARWQREFGEGAWTAVATTCYERMAAVDFSGPEKHGTRRSQQWLQRLQRR